MSVTKGACHVQQQFDQGCQLILPPKISKYRPALAMYGSHLDWTTAQQLNSMGETLCPNDSSAAPTHSPQHETA